MKDKEHIDRPGRRAGGAPRLWRARMVVAMASVLVPAVQVFSGCGLLTESTVVINVGYQSKTINTVNAGTLLRDRGEFEKALNQLGRSTGKKYRVVWQDFSSGAPLTAQMIASHVDIGSMGDYPLLVNGSKTKKYSDAETELIALTGYSLRGSLNQVVIPTRSPVRTLADLAGKRVSTSLGSAGDGMFSTALQRNGINPRAVHTVNQDPSIGASAIQGGQVDALAQFVPWPQLVIFRNQGRLLYDGGDNNLPTFHGVVVRKLFAEANQDVMAAFMRAMKTTTDYIVANPLFTDTSICIGCKACEVACKEWNRNPRDGELELLGLSYDNTGSLGASTWRHVAFIEQGSDRIEQARESGRALVSLGMPAVPKPTDTQSDPRPPDIPEFRLLMSSDVCKHCTHAGCLDVCPTGALFRTEFGTVVVQHDVCNGCGTCVAGCPFGVVERRSDGTYATPAKRSERPEHEFVTGVAQKCTLFYDRLLEDQTPACAQTCPTTSIKFGDHDDLVAKARERVAQLHAQGRTEARLYGANEHDGVGGTGSIFLLLDEPEVYGLPPIRGCARPICR